MAMKLFSPVNGMLIPLESVDDPAFAEKMLGDGLAVRPAPVRQAVVSPVDGIVANLSQTLHAVMISAGEYEILVHIGIDTVTLKGAGFQALVKNGDKVIKGQRLVEVDFTSVAPKVPSIDVIIVVTNLNENHKLVKSSAEKLSVGDKIFTVSSGSEDDAEPEPVPDDGEVVSPPCEIVNEVGIHARPALMISQIAAHYEFVQLKKGAMVANAKSIASLMGLNAKYKDTVQIIARGKGGAQAVHDLMKAISSGLGEAGKSSTPAKETANTEKPVITDFSKTVQLEGLTASPGFIIGKSFLYQQRDIPVEENASDSIEQLALLEESLRAAAHQLRKDIQNATDRKQATKVDIYKAHLGILKDECILDEAKNLIKIGKSAAFAWRKATETSTKALSEIDTPLLKERLIDFKDVERRLIRIILGISDDVLTLAKDTIVVARDLMPSDLTKFENAAGYLLAEGSSTSHVSLIIRNIGCPCVVAAGKSALNIPDNTSIILDAGEGRVTVNPESAFLSTMREKQQELEIIRERNVKAAKESAVTLDGIKIDVKGNISNAEESRRACELGAEGVGLFRTEFMFLGSTTPPDAETHRRLYQEVVDMMPSGKITIRMLDVGGDKPIPYIYGTEGEENPIIGLRGVRNYPVNQDVIMEQIRGILHIKPIEKIKIMIPMVADVDEFIWIKTLIEEEKEKLGVTGELEIGTMVEVPSLALISEHMGKYADFFSVGTNDLTQYTLAMDRGNVKLAPRLNNMHPALLKLIKLTVDGGNRNTISTAVCGAMASMLQAIPLLIGLGVTELSTSMKSIPDVKALIRILDSRKCKEVADKALAMESAAAVTELVRKSFNI